MAHNEETRIRFDRIETNPVIPPTPGTFYSKYTANPDLLWFRDKYHLYFRGQGEAGHDQIGVALAEEPVFDGTHWKIHPEVLIPVSPDPEAFDSGYILDPAAQVLHGKVHLYYTAHSARWKDWNIPSHVGLALSEDGIHFEKHPEAPVIQGTSPEIVIHRGKVHLFFQRKTEQGFFEIWCAAGDDGVHFPLGDQCRIFGPSQQAGAFDRFSISTVRIWPEGEWFYMTYGGCDRYFDYPCAIGLARSRDLLHWERYPHNPIFERGAAGAWDEGALWFATLFKKDDLYYLWYEGTGTGGGCETPQAEAASRRCREDDYGGYGETSFSAIGLAHYRGDLTNWS